MKNAVLFLTHVTNDVVYDRYRKLRAELPDARYDVIFLLNNYSNNKFNIPDDITEYYVQSRNDIYDLLRKRYYFYRHKDFMWHNMHLVMLDFFLKHKNKYKYYYLIEYDVVFNGDWNFLFTNLENYCNDIDFIAPKIIRYWENEKWYWFKSYICINGTELNKSQMLGSLNAFYRISNDALIFLEEEYLTKYGGFHECMMITLLHNSRKFKIANLFDTPTFNMPGISGKFASIDTFDYKKNFDEIPKNPDNKLYHPVKI